MRFVAIKTVEQQARLAWHRVREGDKAEALAIGNRLRGLLAVRPGHSQGDAAVQ